MHHPAQNQLNAALVFALALLNLGVPCGVAQTVVTPWGNLSGMRVEGEPVEFEAGVRVVHPEWVGFSGAVKYLQRPSYSRIGPQATVESEIEGLSFRETVTDTGPGKATLDLQVSAKTNLVSAGTYFFVDLPDSEFGGGKLEVLGSSASATSSLMLSSAPEGDRTEYLRTTATGVRITAPRRSLELRWAGPRIFLVRRELSSRPTSLNDPAIRQQFLTHRPSVQPTSYQLYFELLASNAPTGQSSKASLQLEAKALSDSQPVRLTLDPARPGRPFDGIGGNVRLQFPKTDAAVLGYNLANLPVAWGRFDLFWAEWHPEESLDPLAVARAGQLHPKIADAMETARELARRRIPIIVSAWVPPKWARASSQPAGLRGTALNLEKLDRICSSLASYLVFLKEHAGVEARFFSFNEPETGVEVRQTAAEHVQFIKLMGPELAKRGLTTRQLLGDTAHGTSAALDYIRPALADAATHPYLGAIAFHTWRGCTAESLPGWADAARQLGVPLMVTESGPDAHMHEYPGVRLEPWFQLQEIELYVRTCALGQPSTIMEWQFTTDYSVLRGGGVYGEAGPLKPTQRFWNLKQLGLTPPGAFALPISATRPEITCAAFGDLANGQFILHIVNQGGKRPAVLAGLPKTLVALRRFTTDAKRGMEETKAIKASDGKTQLVLPEASYTTLLGGQATRSR
jgi:hypothetical protein